MNVNDIKTAITRTTGRTGLQLKQHSPEILLALGLAGFVTTVVLAVKASKKVDGVAEITKASLQAIDTHEDMTDQDKIKAKATVVMSAGVRYGKAYGPAASIGIASIVAILASHGVMKNRQVALVAAYNLLNEGFKEYRTRVAFELGEEKERDFYLGLKEETRTETSVDEAGNKVKTKVTKKGVAGKAPSVYSRFFDESNPMFRTDRHLNKAFLIAQQNYLNDQLNIRGHVFLNEAYERLGFDHTREGAIVGWVLKDPDQMKKEGRDGYIDLGIFDVENDPAREFVNLTNPSILIDPNVDGIIFEQLKS